MASLHASLGRPAKARFKREAVYQIKLTPHHHSCRAFTRLLDLETAILIAEVLTVLCKEPKDKKVLRERLKVGVVTY